MYRQTFMPVPSTPGADQFSSVPQFGFVCEKCESDHPLAIFFQLNSGFQSQSVFYVMCILQSRHKTEDGVNECCNSLLIFSCSNDQFNSCCKCDLFNFRMYVLGAWVLPYLKGNQAVCMILAVASRHGFPEKFRLPEQIQSSLNTNLYIEEFETLRLLLNIVYYMMLGLLNRNSTGKKLVS